MRLTAVLGGALLALVVVLGGALLATAVVVMTAGGSAGRRTGRPTPGPARRPRRPVLEHATAGVAFLALMVLGGATASTVAAHFNGTSNSSIARATRPVGGGTTYSGRFATSGDVDYYHFTTTRPNVTLRFTVRNTLASCNNGNCQLYASLIDPAGKQLGGEGSAAGTGPVGFAGSDYATDTIDWTFPTAGRYLLVFDSDGDLPSYRFSISPPDGLAPGIPAFPAPLFRSLFVASPQLSPRVRAFLTLPQARSAVRLELRRTVRYRSVLAGYVTRSGLGPGRVSLTVSLNAADRAAVDARRGGVRMTLRTRVTAGGRSATASRSVLVR
ncbi:MAG: hypothetical protein ACR2NH_10475 [Solirubrobacteraceae bacterium]